MDLTPARELLHAATRCDEVPEVRAVFITGSGSAFSTGGDVRDFSSAGEDLPSLLKNPTTHLHAAVSRLVRAPVIAAVNGVAAGGGLSLVLASDLVFAAESASFHYAYSRIGLSPDGSSTYFLPRLLGMRRALEFALMGRALSARGAHEWGLVNRVVTDSELT
jgi:2-(1,2-epoxy-1,2-dihydrophenyl)acetyl-CoA isomerase